MPGNKKWTENETLLVRIMVDAVNGDKGLSIDRALTKLYKVVRRRTPAAIRRKFFYLKKKQLDVANHTSGYFGG